MYKDSGWAFNIQVNFGDEEVPIKIWNSKEIYRYEYAAGLTAGFLCNGAPCWYETFEHGELVWVTSPSGEVRMVQVTGESVFQFSASEVEDHA